MSPSRPFPSLLLPLFLSIASCAAPAAPKAPGAPQVIDRTADFKGSSVHYLDGGSGDEGLVFVHGWACEVSSWRHQLPVFAERGRVLAIDLPGHGASEDPEIECSMDLFADAIAAVMDNAGVERAVLVGHSNGTPAVRQFWRRYPERTRALVAVDGALRGFDADQAMVDAMAKPFEGEGYQDAAATSFAFMLSGDIPEDVREDLISRTVATPQHVMVEALRAAMDQAIWADDKIDVPVLCVMAQSPFWTDDYEAYIRELCPDVRYVVMKGVPHFLMVAAPDEFNETLTEFLDAKGL